MKVNCPKCKSENLTMTFFDQALPQFDGDKLVSAPKYYCYRCENCKDYFTSNQSIYDEEKEVEGDNISGNLNTKVGYLND